MIDIKSILSHTNADKWDEIPTWFLVDMAAQAMNQESNHGGIDGERIAKWQTGEGSERQVRATCLRWLT